MSVGEAASRVLLAAGVAVIIASSLGMLTIRRPQNRLHFVTPVTSVGVPLVGLAVVLDTGIGLASAEVVLIVVLQFVTGAALGSATGRLVGQREGLLAAESPE